MTAARSTPSLAEMMFLVGHDEGSGGEPLIRPELLPRAVMAALLADLSVARRIKIVNGYVCCTEDTLGGRSRAPGSLISAADDAGSCFIEHMKAQEKAFTVRQWLRQLAVEIHFRVAQQLVDTGVLRYRRSSRRIVRHATDCYPPVSLVVAAAPRLALARCFHQPREFDLTLGVLAGLCAAVGLLRFVDPTLPQTLSNEILDELMSYMPTDLREIINCVEQIAASEATTPWR